MYQTFIGLEVHIHLLTKTKVFCGCRAAFGDEPNTNICPVCMGYPGVMPALNAEALRMACLVARALGCRVPDATWFERKQYFYPDMPKNYQISQFAAPLGQEGSVKIEGGGIKKTVRIRECHLEEDAGKMMHTGAVSLLDYNRAGVSLLEIVTEPDMETGEEAELFVQQLRRTVRYLGVCDGNMEEGSLRADANVSINLPGAGLGQKVEIKNLNSSRFIRLGLNYEIKRQAAALDAGKTITQETRLWNENRDETLPMRTKENSKDYRFFPEPDLPVFIPDAAFRAEVEAGLVELPLPRAKRIAADYALGIERAALICEEREVADYYEAAVAAACGLGMERTDAAERVANRLLSDVKHILSRDSIAPSAIGSIRLTAARLAELTFLVASGKLSNKNAKQTLEAVFAEDKGPAAIVAERGWEQISDPAAIAEAVGKVWEAEAATVSDAADALAGGNQKKLKALTAYLVGKTLAVTGGRASPDIAGQLVEERLRT